MMPNRTIFRIHLPLSKMAVFVLWLYMGMWHPLLVGGVLAPQGSSLELEAAGAEPGAAVAEPNLGTLLGIGNPLGGAGNPAALLQGIGGGAGHPSLSGPPHGAVPNLQALRDSGALGAICNNAGNSDALTNLLVYQYLSGSLPGGGANGGTQAAVPGAVGNPHLQALLEGSRESKTATSVTTTLTTRTITMEASTKFSTSTTSYVTTVTSLTSSILPIIFRGSKITTTITDRKTEVLTATEFHTSSSVLTPSIIQTLNVEITLTQTSTKGLNGLFTLAQVTPGPSKVHETPISSHSVGFEQVGLSNLDLRHLGKGDKNSQVVDALTALLQKYNDEPVPEEEEPDRKRGRGRPRGRERNQNRFGNTRFHNRPRENSAPKNNVIRGSTFRDPPAAAEDDGPSGTALENTRYSKFRKKSNVDNNSLRSSADSDRERERFSASNSRRTVSSTNRRKQTPPRSASSRTGGVRSNRQTERSRRRSERTLEAKAPENDIKAVPPKESVHFQTTLLTMHISGDRPGETITTVRTVTLRGVGTERIKRQVQPEPVTPPIASTTLPDQGFRLQPKDVVKLLKNLNKSTVRRMLYSLHGWVDYYLHQVLDEIIEPSFNFERFSDIVTNQIPELYPSQIEEDLSSSQGEETTALDSIPNAITSTRNTLPSSSPNICPKVSVVTETVYKTLTQAHPH